MASGKTSFDHEAQQGTPQNKRSTGSKIFLVIVLIFNILSAITLARKAIKDADSFELSGHATSSLANLVIVGLCIHFLAYSQNPDGWKELGILCGASLGMGIVLHVSRCLIFGKAVFPKEAAGPSAETLPTQTSETAGE